MNARPHVPLRTHRSTTTRYGAALNAGSRRKLKRIAAAALARARLLGPAFRLYESALALLDRGPEPDPRAVGALPLPPRKLRVRVAGMASAQWFLDSGELIVRAMEQALDDAGTSLSGQVKVLEFGSGCGRVMRHLEKHDGRLYGTDYSTDQIEWSRRNLPFATFDLNGTGPPLRYADESFDLVYAISVFTHMTEAEQRSWLEEIGRVVRPGGFVLFTTHGQAYRERLDENEAARFDAGELVVRRSELSGTNLCATFHPERYVRERLTPAGFWVSAFLPQSAVLQDVYVLTKTPTPGGP